MANGNYLVGITGGMGAGKSTVSAKLRSLGYPVLSADDIARSLTSPGGAAHAAVLQLFGAGIVGPSGELDRGRIRAEISRSGEKRAALEAITHPMIQAESRRLAEAEFARGAQIVFYEAPLLFEAKSESRVDAVICVVADDQVRAARIASRDGVSDEAARKLMNTQMSQEKKAGQSRWTIANNGDMAALDDRIDQILTELNSIVEGSDEPDR